MSLGSVLEIDLAPPLLFDPEQRASANYFPAKNTSVASLIPVKEHPFQIAEKAANNSPTLLSHGDQ